MKRTASISTDPAAQQQASKPKYLNRTSSLLTPAPKNESWIRHGIVERKTEYNDMWRERQMMLTSTEVCFARPDSDVLVDCINLAEVVFVGKVDRAHDPIADAVGKRTHQKASLISRIDSLEDLQGGFRETFAFEIKVVSGNAHRSYLARVDDLEECEAWITSIKSCLKKGQEYRAARDSKISRIQRRVKRAYDSSVARYIIVTVIFVDFIASLVQSEYVPLPDTPMFRTITHLDEALFVFFAAELAVNAFANWRTALGAPFGRNSADMLQILTVVLQSALFFKPVLSDFKVVCTHARARARAHTHTHTHIRTHAHTSS
jgi:hypothetical protein